MSGNDGVGGDLPEVDELLAEMRALGRRFERVSQTWVLASTDRSPGLEDVLMRMVMSLQTLPEHAADAAADALSRQRRRIVAEVKSILNEAVASSWPSHSAEPPTHLS